MTVKVHVNTHVIKANQKTGAREPPITIRRGRQRTYAMEIEMLGPVRMVYRPDKPMDCGARVWIECDDVSVIS